MEPNKKEDLVFVKELIESGMVVPVVDRCYEFSEVAEAMRYLEQGKHRGKIVITML
jgi:NADPH:quinone reductase-like Zn-dependent oxidoreductase